MTYSRDTDYSQIIQLTIIFTNYSVNYHIMHGYHIQLMMYNYGSQFLKS